MCCFRLYKVTDKLGPQQCRVYSATDEAGKGIGAIDGPQWKNVTHAWIKTVSAVKPGSELGDKLWSIGGNFVVSERARQSLETLKGCDSLIFIPATVTNTRDEVIADYYVVYAPQRCDALDYEKSTFEYFRAQPDVIMNVNTWSFIRDQIPHVDLFQARQGDWIVTETLVSEFQSAGLSGFNFVLIWEDTTL